MTRLVLGVAALGAVLSLAVAPAPAHAIGCLIEGWSYQPSGYYDPRTGQPIMICKPRREVAR